MTALTDWLADLPLYWATIVASVFFAAVMIWVLLIPRKYIYRGASDGKRWRDLRIWAVAILLLQVALYIYF